MNSFGSDMGMPVDSDRALLESFLACHYGLGELGDITFSAPSGILTTTSSTSASSFSAVTPVNLGELELSQVLSSTPCPPIDLFQPTAFQASVKSEDGISMMTSNTDVCCAHPSPSAIKANGTTLGADIFPVSEQQEQHVSGRNSADGSESEVDASYFDQYEPHELEEVPKPEQLEKEPWYITLKSAGVRVKGRSRRELLEVADKIKKRRRESAARSRAKKANKISSLTSENGSLRAENSKLKALLQKLIGESSGDTSSVAKEFADALKN